MTDTNRPTTFDRLNSSIVELNDVWNTSKDEETRKTVEALMQAVHNAKEKLFPEEQAKLVADFFKTPISWARYNNRKPARTHIDGMYSYAMHTDDKAARSNLDIAERYNSGKPELSMIAEAGPALEGLARVLEFGKTKYVRSNWTRGFPTTALIDSLLRHVVAYMSGEDNDPETNLPHADHIFANAMFLSYNNYKHPEMDDRT